MPGPDRAVLTLRLPTPWPVGDVNAYFIDGPEPILVDTGVSSSKSIDALNAQLSARGRSVAEIRHILVTHGHYDHAGASRRLSRDCAARLHLHERSVLEPRLEMGTLEAQVELLVRCGVPRDLFEEAARLFEGEARFADLAAAPHAVTTLRGGETFSCGGVGFTAIATPGHSPDHLCYLDDRGALYSGDMLLPHITPNPLLYLDPDDGMRRYTSLLDYLGSLDRLEGLSIAACRPGHGREIPDAKAHLAGTREFIARRAAQFQGEIARGPVTPFDLARAVFGALDVTNQYLAISETIAYLDLLARDGTAAVDWDAAAITASTRA